MDTLYKIVASLWTAFVILSVCLGFFADFPTGRSQLEDSLSNILPLGAALLPYIAFAGVVGFGGRILVWAIKWSIDHLKEGPEIRRLKGMQYRIKLCKSLLESLDNPARMVITQFETETSFIQLNMEWRHLRIKMESVGVDTSEINLTDQSQGDHLLDATRRSL